MTREEAITVIKALMENPIFLDEHKQAFNIAIHDIKQRHDWDINNLILINKENYEPAEQEPILDKVKQAREEIQKLVDMCGSDTVADLNMKSGLGLALEKINKLIESEG